MNCLSAYIEICTDFILGIRAEAILLMSEKYGLRREITDALIDIATDCNIRKIILFGSRARGDFKKTSDIDIAVYGVETERFAIEIEDRVPTLLEFDVVDMKKPVQEDLKASIEKEGVVIYEKV